jgi:hypothetical protein
MAITSGSISRKLSTQLTKQALNGAGSSAASTPFRVSWLGMPCRKGRNRRKKASCSLPQSSISTQSSAPASVALSRSRMISGRG